MRTRLTALMMLAGLLLGVAACDDTADGIQEDAEEIQEGAEDAVEDLEDGS